MAAQPRILVLGFGGTGLEALLQLKALFSQDLGDVPPYCALLYLDTVAVKSNGQTSLRDVECARLLLRDPTEMLRNPSNSYIREWFPPTIRPQTAALGAAQCRPVGRLALHAQPERVVSQIRHCLDALTDRARLREAKDGASIDDEGSVEVYILASLCGGTGAGIFLDVARLVREELRDAPTVRFFGVLLLPGPFKGLAGTELVGPNAYAALKELDYLAAPRDSVDFNFGPSRAFQLDRSPFDLVYLVDSVGERYDTTKTVPHLARQMAHLPYVMATPTIGPYIRETLHNLIPQLESKGLVHGKRATYASFGVATLALSPASVAAARQKFKLHLLQSLLADADSVQGLGDIGAGDTVNKCAAVRLPEHLELLLLEVNFGNPKEPLDKLGEIYAATVNLLDEYARGVAEPHRQALRSAGETAVSGLMADAVSGPGRLAAALRECAGLRRVFEGLLHSVRTPPTPAEHAEKERKRTWEACREAFKSRRRRKREQAANEWREAVNTFVLPVRLVETVNAVVSDGIGYVIDRVREAEQSLLLAQRNIKELISEVSAGSGTTDTPPDPFTRLGDAQTISPTPDARQFLIQSSTACIEMLQSVQSLRSAIHAFSQSTFDPAFSPGGPASATRLLVQNVDSHLTELRRFSAPLWSYSPSKIPPEHHRGIHHLEILGVDKRSGEVDAIQSQHSSVTVLPTGWSDRVMHLQIRAGVPLFALTCMDDLWREYSRMSENPGREICHIDRRWVGWPEPLAHAFAPKVVQTFAHGLITAQIGCTSAGIEFSGASSKRMLGDTFLAAYRTLENDNELMMQILRCACVPGSNGDGPDRVAADLWSWLLNDSVSVHDRPLVEAVLRSVDRGLSHGALW
jgi:hypothetical protein